MMNGLLRSTMQAMPLTILGVGTVCLLIELYRRRVWERCAERNQERIERIAETAARDTAAIEAVLEQFPPTANSRRIRSVRDRRNA
jgi:hypothetical protein